MKNKKFDYIIAGGGASGLTLAFLLMESKYREKSILLIDRDNKSKNDRTWCFWELGDNLFENLVYHRWENAKVAHGNFEKNFHIPPYAYKMIRGIDFYDFMKHYLSSKSQVVWLQEEIIRVEDSGMVKTNRGTYEGGLVFDSTFDPKMLNSENSNTLLQHFHGKIINTKKAHFDPISCTYMDFRMSQEEDCRFGYVLPFSEHKALVEYTIFNQALLSDEAYEEGLDKYIQQLGIDSYQTDEIEHGVIPMTDFPFQIKQSSKVYRIGIKGGFVKASTGYSFLRAQKILMKMVSNLESHRAVEHNLPFQSKRFKRYDATLIDVLVSDTYRGADIFGRLFEKNGAHAVFQFLDENTHLFEEMKIMASLPTWGFSKSFMKQFL